MCFHDRVVLRVEKRIDCSSELVLLSKRKTYFTRVARSSTLRRGQVACSIQSSYCENRYCWWSVEQFIEFWSIPVQVVSSVPNVFEVDSNIKLRSISLQIHRLWDTFVETDRDPVEIQQWRQFNNQWFLKFLNLFKIIFWSICIKQVLFWSFNLFGGRGDITQSLIVTLLGIQNYIYPVITRRRFDVVDVETTWWMVIKRLIKSM